MTLDTNVLSLDKTKLLIKSVTSDSPECALSIGCNGRYVEESENTNSHSPWVDNHPNQ